MRILMVASEAALFLRTSDVANVVTELSLQLRRQGLVSNGAPSAQTQEP